MPPAMKRAATRAWTLKRDRWEEYHVVLDAEIHELNTPEPNRHPKPERVVGTCHLECWRELGVFHATLLPYQACQLSIFRPWALNQPVNKPCDQL
jgi:hypothetical protein